LGDYNFCSREITGQEEYGQGRQKEKNVPIVQGQTQAVRNRQIRDREHSLKKSNCLGDVFGAEKHPADHNDKQRYCPAHHPVFFRGNVTHTADTFQNQEHAMVNSPEKKRPVRSMPEPAQYTNNRHVKAGSRSPPAVAAEGNIEVIPEPAAQCHVPAAPKIRDAYGRIGAVEIFGKCKSKQQAQSDSHVGIRGEIEINLKGIGNRAEPGDFCVQQLKVEAENNVCDPAAGIGNHYFFGQTPAKAHDAYVEKVP